MKKCIPVLLYGVEVCDLPKRTIQSLDFSVNRVLMKLFRSSNIRACEKELLFLDMAINAKKSCCLRIGPRCNVDCADILTHDGCSLRWVAELRYLGIFIARARTFRCSLNYAKRSFFGVVNGLFGKLLNLASETVILELVRSKYTTLFHHKVAQKTK